MKGLTTLGRGLRGAVFCFAGRVAGSWEAGVLVNGVAREEFAGLAVSAAVAAMGLDAARVAVEVNGTIVPRTSFGEVVLAAGDVVEVVQFVAGG